MRPLLLGHVSGPQLNGFDNVLIAGTTAKIALELFPNFCLSGFGMAGAQIHRAHDHSRRAKSTLQSMTLFESRLHGMQGAIGTGQTFNGCYICAFDLCSQDVA